jgi:hypothetical protein
MKTSHKLIVLVLAAIALTAWAHDQQYQGKAYAFQSPQRDHVISVSLEGHDNELIVLLDSVEIGTRTNFCTPVQ